MDPFTHVIVGATTAQLAARCGQTRQAALAGGLAGIVPDLDIFLPTGGDSLTGLLLHRQFSHSFAFMPLGALFAATVAWLLLRRRPAFGRTCVWALLASVVHAPLDALNAYGTVLLWPLSDARVQWPIMPVVEVAFTATLLLALAVAIARNAPTFARAGLVFALCYLALAAVQHDRARDAAERLAEQRGTPAERILVHPTVGNIVLWHSLYAHGGDYYVDALQLPPGGAPRVYAGERVPALERTAFAGDTRLARDVERFAWFADGWLVRDPEIADFLGDLRYGVPPHRARPLWGIEIDPADPSAPAHFRHARDARTRDWSAFVRMIVGGAVDADDTDDKLWRFSHPEPIDE